MKLASHAICAAGLVLSLDVASSALAAEPGATRPERHAAAHTKPAPKDAANTSADAKAKADAKALAGMSILGNQEAPKALVIVPWKSSLLGESLDIQKTLDDSRQPIDKEVFLRELEYYEIRQSSK